MVLELMYSFYRELRSLNSDSDNLKFVEHIKGFKVIDVYVEHIVDNTIMDKEDDHVVEKVNVICENEEQGGQYEVVKKNFISRRNFSR